MTKPTTKTVAALRKARYLIERGWTQGTCHRVDDNGRDCYCLVGAATMAARSGEAQDRALNLLTSVIDGREQYSFVGSIAQWNDDPERTKEEVLEVLDQAIEKARRRETA